MKLQNKKIMLPPWLAYPKIERYSIGWRMGSGEDYIDSFSIWLEALSVEERTEYQALFPEPITWKGWWQDDDASEILEYGEFFVQLWQPGGTPKYTASQFKQGVDVDKNQDMCLFWGHHPDRNGSITKSCFSQWWMTEFWSIDHHFCCVEQFMMAQKAELFGDEDIRQQILKSKDPKQIKAFGRRVQGFDQKLWDKVKYSIVLNGNWCKFSQNRDLRDFLLATGNSILVEASPYDAIWGIRLPADSPDAQNPLKWQGQNLLGFALMEVRDELRQIMQNESLCELSTLK